MSTEPYWGYKSLPGVPGLQRFELVLVHVEPLGLSSGGVKTCQEDEYPFRLEIRQNNCNLKNSFVKTTTTFSHISQGHIRNDNITFVNWRIDSYRSLYPKDTNGRLHSFVWISSSLLPRPDSDSHSWILDPNIKICYETTCDQCFATERIIRLLAGVPGNTKFIWNYKRWWAVWLRFIAFIHLDYLLLPKHFFQNGLISIPLGSQQNKIQEIMCRNQ